MPENKIYLITDASDLRSGAVLFFGPTWETARPVAFDSMTFKGPELNYPVHEKELLAIIRSLKKWRSDLIGFPFTIYTDHKTLENFMQQKDLSRRQARWMEYMSQYDGTIIYLKGEENTVADALSCLPTLDDTQPTSRLLRLLLFLAPTLSSLLASQLHFQLQISPIMFLPQMFSPSHTTDNSLKL
jgi:hypothetical protein